MVFITVATNRSRAREAAWFEGKPVVDGVLTECIRKDGAENWYYWSTIEYEVNGHRYQLTGDYGDRSAQIGQVVRVAYDTKLPSEARIVVDRDPFD